MPGVSSTTADSTPTASSCIIGVVADTHIPDRARDLHPSLLSALREAGVSHILHAGDICSQRVLDALSSVAPVTAVRGNRDIFLRELMMVEQRDFCGVPIAVTHGHGGVLSYFLDKGKHLLYGYKVDHYIKDLIRAAPSARVIVFGHTHHPIALTVEDKLLFNPGSATSGPWERRGPSFGLINVEPGGAVQTRVVPLTGYVLRRGRWVEQARRRVDDTRSGTHI